MKPYPWTLALALLAATLVASAGRGAPTVKATAAVRPAAAPEAGHDASAAEYTADGRLKFPEHYREWIYLSSGLDMRYTEEGGNPAHSMFDNVFVDPRAYREFLRTGRWADGTVLVLENRGAAQKGSINRHGRYQTGEVMGLEAHVKDTRRFRGGWAFVAFRGRGPADVIAQTADCYSCHREHGAVDSTFVQFYPTLLEIATRKGTLAAGH
ncbi:MAG: cytochrome P460 family protein [Steroidobacteraceae bacterium]